MAIENKLECPDLTISIIDKKYYILVSERQIEEYAGEIKMLASMLYESDIKNLDPSLSLPSMIRNHSKITINYKLNNRLNYGIRHLKEKIPSDRSESSYRIFNNP
jgi:hypothetical protein